MSRPVRVALIEHPRASSWAHMNDVANAPPVAGLMTGYAGASLVRSGYETSIIEGHLAGMTLDEVVSRAVRARVDLVAVHLVYDWSDGSEAAALLEQLAHALGPVPIVLFGFYPTFAWRELLERHPSVTAAVLGEPEQVLVEVAGAVAAGSDLGERLRILPGLAVRTRSKKAGLTPSRPPITDLDAMPFPLRTPESLLLPEVQVAGSRGCHGACSFCAIGPFYGDVCTWRPRSPENVAAELAAVLEAHPWKNRIRFVDPDFFGPGEAGRSRALELAHLLAASFDVRFALEGRVDGIDESLVEALVVAGCDEVLLGLESGSDETLGRLNTGTTVDQNRRAVRTLRAYGIEPDVSFDMFEPQSSLEDVRVNLAFLEEEQLLERLSVTAGVLCPRHIVLRPTPAYQSALAEGRLVVSPMDPYEGALSFRHPEVAFLAETMAECCRHVFVGLPQDILIEDDGRDDRLAMLNHALLALFERLLSGLDGGLLEPGPELTAESVSEMRSLVASVSRPSSRV